MREQSLNVDISLEKFSQLVEVIYAAALDPEQWHEFGRLLAQATDSLVGGISVFDARSQSFEQIYGTEVPDGFFERYWETLPYNPLVPMVTLSELGVPMTNAQVAPEDELLRSRFYHAFMKPLGLRDAIGMVCLRSGPRQAIVVANRAVGHDLYGPRERKLLELLYPHICRALTISDVFDLRTVKSDTLEAALDGLVAGVFLIDARCHVLHMNRAAQRMIESGRLVSVREGRFRPANRDSRDSLMLALARGGQFDLDDVAQEPAIALLTEDGSRPGMIATLLPLGRLEKRTVPGSIGSQWAIFVHDPHVSLPMPGEAFGKLYKLTPTELRVCMALGQGMPTEEAADMMGIGVATVRTHIKHIYAKTGVARQPELVRLMMSTMPPAAGAAPADPRAPELS
jgi:DNA-binding CsgD family transcriptional regulator/PAS domain-containing protein